MKTKIIATIGPASHNYEILKEMIAAGMEIARINTKYGNKEEYLKVAEMIQKIGKCKILYDIKSEDIIEWLKNQSFDYLAVSDAETAQQIKNIKRKFFPKKVKIISKIETHKGIENINSLIRVSDGIMVARGDLGKNISFEKVPLVQKLLIRRCNKKNIMAITATEMLYSIIDSKTPLRSEASDIANAVLDGSDALMLSEETAIGKYPVLAVKIMEKVIVETEKTRKYLV